MVDHFEAMLKGIDDLLGLSLMSVADITDEQKQLIAERQDGPRGQGLGKIRRHS